MELATLEKATQISKDLEWAKRHLETLHAGKFENTTVKIQSDKGEVVLSGRFFNRVGFLMAYNTALQTEIADLTNKLESL